MIRVVEAISDTNIGGAGVLLINRLRHTDRSKFDTTVLLPVGSRLKPRVEKLGAKVVSIKGARDSSADMGSLPAYIEALKRLKPDIINSHGSLISRIAAALVGVPVRVYTRHCVFPLSKIYDLKWARTAVAAVTRCLSHRVIAVAHSAKDDLVRMGVPHNMISVIINGAEALREIGEEERRFTRKALGIEEEHTVVTICARLEPCKDHECFLKAARLLCRGSDRYRFLILGTGTMEGYLKRLSRTLKIDGKVIFCGFVDDVSRFMGVTDINVNCSVGTETSSLALSEGMSIGLPAIVSDYGGNTYMVRNGENGYVYKRGDYRQLAKLISKLTREKEEYARLSKAAKDRYERELNAEAMAHKTQELYERLYRKIPKR